MRSPKRRASSPSAGQQRRAEGHDGAARLGPLHALAEDGAGALEVDRAPRARRVRTDRNAAPPRNGWPHPSGDRPPSGKMQQAPALLQQRLGQVGRAPVHPGAVDRERAEGQGRRRAGDPGGEEVVGRRGDDQLAPPRLGDRGDHHRRVEVAVVVGGEDHRGRIAVVVGRPQQVLRGGRGPRARGRPAPCIARRSGPSTIAARATRAGVRRAHSVSKSAPTFLGSRGTSQPARHRRGAPGEAERLRHPRRASPWCAAPTARRRPRDRRALSGADATSAHLGEQQRRGVQVGDRRVAARRRRRPAPARRPSWTPG